MIRQQAESLLTEIDAGVRLRDRHMLKYDEMLSSYVGMAYKEDGNDSPVNHYFSWVAHQVPGYAFGGGVPEVTISSTRHDAIEEESFALQLAQNKLIRDSKSARLLRRVAVDTGFGPGITVTSQRPVTHDIDDPRRRPQSARLPWKRFGMDAFCTASDDARIMYHLNVADIDDLASRAKRDADLPPDKQEGWDLAAISAMTPGHGIKDLGRPEYQMLPNRNEIVWWTVWVAEWDLEPGSEEFNGGVCDVAWGGGNGKAQFLRKVRPFYGPPGGPYTVFGHYVVPDDPWPLAPLVANYGPISAHERRARVMQESAEHYKRLLFVRDPRTAAIVKNGLHDYLFPSESEDVSKEIQAVEVAGTTQQQVVDDDVAAKRVDNGLGTSDPGRGAVTGVGTATENNIALASTNTIVADQDEQFRQCASTMYSKEAWYMHHDDRVVQVLGAKEAQQLGLPPGIPIQYQGGQKTPWSAMDVSVEAGTLKRSDSSLEQARAQLRFQALLEGAQAAVASPWLDVVGALDELGKTLGDSRLGRFINAPLANAVAAMMLQQQALPEAGGQPENRLAGDVGGGEQAAPQRTMNVQAAPRPMSQPQIQPPKGPAPGRAAVAGKTGKTGSKVGIV